MQLFTRKDNGNSDADDGRAHTLTHAKNKKNIKSFVLCLRILLRGKLSAFLCVVRASLL